jgi:phosphoribosylformimino-5-aminoimidazole carboxamide ribotide isomerase
MIALPAIDLRDGACVQLVGGDYAAERVRIADVMGQARTFRDAGFTWLHVVDLDAATGRGENASLVDRLVKESGLRVQVGGGVRSLERASALLSLGAERVVVGTRAVEDQAFRHELAERHPGKIVVAVDVRGREVLVRGWAEGAGRSVTELAVELAPLPLAGLLVTAVHREGALAGPDIALYEELGRVTPSPLFASGGVGSAGDLERLAEAGCRGAVIGMALYTGALDAAGVAKRYGR